MTEQQEKVIDQIYQTLKENDLGHLVLVAPIGTPRLPQ